MANKRYSKRGRRGQKSPNWVQNNQTSVHVRFASLTQLPAEK